MKKLLISLLCACATTIAFANQLPTGNYSGTLWTPSGAAVVGNGVSEPTLITVNIGPMPDLLWQTGVLTANIIFNTNDCFGGVGKLKLSSGSTLDVTSPTCNINGNVFSGTYKTTFLGIGLTGKYTFTKQ